MKFMKYEMVIIFINLMTVAGDYYCPVTERGINIRSQTYGRIVTLVEGETHYSNNRECIWKIFALTGYRIQLMVDSSHLQWSPSRSLCEGKDHMDISDVNGSLAFWCGNDYPTEVISRGSWLKIVFKTDESNPRGKYYRGVRMTFMMFENTTCPRGWLTVNKSCYLTTPTKQKWDMSQKECNFRQSNLLIVESKEEWDYLSTNVFNESTHSFLWTGLNTIANHDKRRWIDNSSVIGSKGFNIPDLKKYNHCAVVQTSLKRMFMQGCNKALLSAVCKANRTMPTVLFPVPLYKKDKGHSDSIGPILIFGLVIPLTIIGFAVICVICNYKKLCRANKWEVAKTKDDTGQDEEAEL